eukprot:13032985-Alexandrium_andersonii.AAC.1
MGWMRDLTADGNVEPKTSLALLGWWTAPSGRRSGPRPQESDPGQDPWGANSAWRFLWRTTNRRGPGPADLED